MVSCIRRRTSAERSRCCDRAVGSLCAITQPHAAVCPSCCTASDCDATSPADVETSLTAFPRGLLRLSAGTPPTTDRQVKSARYTDFRCPSRRRTVDDHRRRRQCPLDLAFRQLRGPGPVDCTCRCYTDRWWNIEHRRHTWCCQDTSLQSPRLHQDIKKTLRKIYVRIKVKRAQYGWVRTGAVADPVGGMRGMHPPTSIRQFLHALLWLLFELRIMRFPKFFRSLSQVTALKCKT